MSNTVIISESKRPYWQIPLASLFLTAGIGFLLYSLYKIHWNGPDLSPLRHNMESVLYLISIGICLCYQKSVYIDIEKSKFRSTFEIGPIKLGQWKTVSNYEYVSLFHQPLDDGNRIFEVNLWYNKNKHWELYEKYDYKDAFKVAFELSELLNIGLLDATVSNDYKWIDKKASKETGKIVYSN